MKKIISMILALTLVLSMGAVAFAEGTTYTDMSTVTLTKEYKLTNDGTTSPAEVFTFTTLVCTEVKDAGVDVNKDNAPVPTIASVSYNEGEAGSATAKKDITITLPNYTAVGIYTYTFNEVDGATAGVTYRSEPIKLVVSVIEQDGKIRVAAIHTENDGGAKSSEFNNTYSAGSLAVKKNVTGLLGDQEKEFNVKVTFTAPEGDIVKGDISYTDGAKSSTIEGGWNDSKEVTITLKHNETVTFTNIPYGVTYNVVEDDYTDVENGCYDAASYSFDDTNKIIDSATDNVTITNNKDGEIDTGITTDSLPYIMLLGAVALVGIVMFIKRRAYND